MCVALADKEPGGEEAVGALPQEADCRKPSSFTSTEGKENEGVLFSLRGRAGSAINDVITVYVLFSFLWGTVCSGFNGSGSLVAGQQ